MRYLTVQEIIMLNQYLIQTFNPKEDTGVKDWNLLESAVFRPQTPAFGKDAYTTVFEKAAALFESLAQNHSFQNANKRTALESMFFFLRYNNYRFKMPTEEKIEFTVDVVQHKYSFDKIAAIIKEHSMLHVD